MRFLSLLCSIILHLFIVYIAIFITKNNIKIDLDKIHTYKITIVRLEPKKNKTEKKAQVISKKAKIIKKTNSHISAKKKVIKISKKTSRRKKKRPVKINIKKQKEKVVKSAFKDVLASLKKEELKKEIVKSAVKKISKVAETEEDSGNEGLEETIEKYKALAEIKIKSNWRYPVKDPNLTAELAIEVDKEGNILKIKFIKSSGNKIFDNSAIRAIKETNKLDPFPRSLGNKNKKIVIFITFGRAGEK